MFYVTQKFYPNCGIGLNSHGTAPIARILDSTAKVYTVLQAINSGDILASLLFPQVLLSGIPGPIYRGIRSKPIT